MKSGTKKPPYIVRPSTYVFSSPESAERAFAITLGKARAGKGESLDLIYARLSHPNAEILEDQIVPLEPEAAAAAVFNSGMAAISTLFLTLCPQGSSFVYTMPLYGGTHHLIHRFLEPLGIHGIAVPAGATDAMTAAILGTTNLRMVYIETPANPTLVMSDIAAAATAAHTHPDLPLVAVDNTFMGPTFQPPLLQKADLTVYSATKFLSGSSDLLAGVILGRDPELIVHLRSTRAILGNILQADECWMLNGRLPTVNLRMIRQSKNAQRIAESLATHTKIEKMYYPALFDVPEQIRIREAQCRFPGSIISFDLHGGKDAAFEFLRNIQIARTAVSLGGIESLACHPHNDALREMSGEDRMAAGVSDSLIRISVSIEDCRDLLHDFRQALDAI